MKDETNYRGADTSPAFGNPAGSCLLTPVALRPSFARGVPLSVQVLLQITGGSWLGASFWKLNKCKEKVSTGLSRVVLGAV